jgi:hypothetical protein
VSGRTLPTARAALLVGVAALAAHGLLDLLVRDQPVPIGDELIYERMALAPGDPHTFPFAYRVLGSWLVAISPFSTTFSFGALAWLAAAGAAALLFATLERLELPRRLSVPLAIALAISPVLLVASLRQGRNPDPISVLVMCAGALCIVTRSPRALAAVVLVGAFNRESALFLVPWAYAVWAERLWDARVARTVALAALPGVVTYAALRLAIPTVGSEQVIGYGDGFVQGRLDVVEQNLDQPLTTARRVFLALGPLWLVAPFALRDWSWARRSLVLIACVLAAFTFTLDWGRAAVMAAPAVCAAAAYVLRERPRWALPVLASWFALIAGYALYMQVHGVEHGLIDAAPPSYPIR